MRDSNIYENISIDSINVLEEIEVIALGVQALGAEISREGNVQLRALLVSRCLSGLTKKLEANTK